MMKYKEYYAVVEFDEDAETFHGRTVGTRDVITFEGSTAAELKRAFRDSVEFYLSLCKKKGKDPDKPFSGKFVIRLTPEQHRRVFATASARGKSMNEWIAEVLEQAAREA